ncbi:sporulation histidine kinase inhibitor Sda [Niallia sp. 03133]|uniref:sporulation histidine kinase inhibitor Sda n=1 Tax=Niallia sp. 03133 TaxID=3458060 RepID=UPI004044840E
MSTLNLLSDHSLLEAYIDARKLNLSSEFIQILRAELFNRGLIQIIQHLQVKNL